MSADKNTPKIDCSVYPMKFSASALRPKVNDPSLQKALLRFKSSEQVISSVSGTWFECVLKELEAAPAEVIEKHEALYKEGRRVKEECKQHSFVKVATLMLIEMLELIAARRDAEGVTVPGPDWDMLRRLIAMGDTGAVCEAQKLIDNAFDWDGLGKEIIAQGGIASSMLAVMPERDPIRLFSDIVDGIYPDRSSKWS